MPLTLPDGQTPLDYLDLESVGHIEVIRGAASALYGNASGGVIDIHSVDPTANVAPEARAWIGSNATRRTTAVVSGMTGGGTEPAQRRPAAPRDKPAFFPPPRPAG